ncbi:unnamed protein product [Prunus armeniaca]
MERNDQMRQKAKQKAQVLKEKRDKKKRQKMQQCLQQIRTIQLEGGKKLNKGTPHATIMLLSKNHKLEWTMLAG